MPVKPKAKVQAGDSSPITVLAEWARQGTESFFVTQKILLDLVVRQNSHTISAIRERLMEARSARGNPHGNCR